MISGRLQQISTWVQSDIWLKATSVIDRTPIEIMPGTGPRPEAAGKFFRVGHDKLRVRGVTYGTFRPDARGGEFPTPSVVENDFRQMAAVGINAVRTRSEEHTSELQSRL